MGGSNLNYIMNLIDGIGGVLLVVGMIPQIYQTFKTKKAEDLNLQYLSLLTVGLAMMESYAFYLVVTGGAKMFLFTNSIDFSFVIILLVMKLWYSIKTINKK